MTEASCDKNMVMFRTQNVSRGRSNGSMARAFIEATKGRMRKKSLRFVA